MNKKNQIKVKHVFKIQFCSTQKNIELQSSSLKSILIFEAEMEKIL